MSLSSITEAEEGGPSVVLIEGRPGLLPEVLSVRSVWSFLRYTLNVEPMGLRQFGTYLASLGDALEGILCGNPFTLWGDTTERFQCARVRTLRHVQQLAHVVATLLRDRPEVPLVVRLELRGTCWAFPLVIR
ncbi:hypothetical protein GJJPMMHO_00255 [Klebsiella phage 150009]|nr:hypothetical protein GJJPMMHO_00255 [Klebsiella phage 150009]